eukprot:5353479-Alexandrium_andersonii.AAC.1
MPGVRRTPGYKRRVWPSSKAAAWPSFFAAALPRMGPAPRQCVTATSTRMVRPSAPCATKSTLGSVASPGRACGVTCSMETGPAP